MCEDDQDAEYLAYVPPRDYYYKQLYPKNPEEYSQIIRRIQQALRDKIRERTGRTRSGSLESILMELNPILRGWFGYFYQAHRSTFRDVDGFVRRRLRAILRKREKRPGFGRTSRDHLRWPNAFFATAGLFALHPAWQAARHSR